LGGSHVVRLGSGSRSTTKRPKGLVMVGFFEKKFKIRLGLVSIVQIQLGIGFGWII